MATLQFRGRVRNGAIELTDAVDLPDGAEVVVTVQPWEELPERVREFLNHPAIGMWKDREDMADPVEWVRKMREEAWRRRINPD